MALAAAPADTWRYSSLLVNSILGSPFQHVQFPHEILPAPSGRVAPGHKHRAVAQPVEVNLVLRMGCAIKASRLSFGFKVASLAPRYLGLR